MRKLINLAALAALLAWFSAVAPAQDYTLEKTAVAGGGLPDGAGGSFTISATAGQTAAGNARRGGVYAMTVGFWNYSPLEPTAAGAGIAGRVLTASGQGIRNARLVLTSGAGEPPRYAQTGSFGYFRFENVPVGATYVLTVHSKRFVFAPPTRIIALTGDLTEVNFTGEP